MTPILDVAPARRVLEDAAAENAALGHDNRGSLSYDYGFLPRTEPAKSLPASHAAWDQIAADIPYLFRNFATRRGVDDLPVLSADEADLPDADLLRASSLMSILAHAYWYAEPEPPTEGGIPPQIQRPWQQITRRLDRPAPHLSFIDLNSHNWHFVDPDRDYRFAAENLKLAIPMIGNEDERRFQMTPVELLYQFAPLLDAMLRAQEAVLHDDPAALKQALVTIGDALKFQTFVTLMKVSANPYSATYINPVVWGKTAALYASPFQPDNAVPGPSGTAIPSFTSLDIFFGRRTYHTSVGTQTDRTRAWFPPHWRDWLDALESLSVGEYVARRGDAELSGIYDDARDAYAGDSGMLSRHRLKAYGFLDLSFKAGRVKTLGGTSGSYSERVWDKMATELDEARLERYGLHPQTTHRVPIARVETVSGSVGADQPVRRIVFDISGTGMRYQAGDRLGILPENGDDLIDRTLKALRARGDEPVQLNAVWRRHVALRTWQDAAELPLRTLLRYGRIRPVERHAAISLHQLSHNGRLRAILDAWAEDQWELWDLLDLLAEGGYNPRRLWKALPGESEHICRLVAPERWRLYSISSAPDAAPDEIHLTIGGLRYRTADSDVSRAADRWGTASGYLTRLCLDDSRDSRKTLVPVKVVHPPRFSLPADPTRPVVLIAGGTGIAPMRGLIEQRARTPNSGATWLFFSTRTRDDFHYQDELAGFVAAGKLDLRVAFSRDDAAAYFDPDSGQFSIVPDVRQHLGDVMLDGDNARLLWKLLRSPQEGGQGAIFYVCGRTAFANSVIEAVRGVIDRFSVDQNPDQMLYRLVGEDRFLLEIFTTYAGAQFEDAKRQIDVSDVVLHNDDQHGYWIVLNNRVYDMNVFNGMHPGGAKIIQSYAGMDGTVAYQKVEHHLNPEVDAMLGMYELGVLRALDLGESWGVALTPDGMRLVTLRDAYQAWVDLLYVLVEIENALANDLRVRDEPFTDAETVDDVLLTPSKVEQLGRAHERLVTSYLDSVLGAPLDRLWRLTVGLVGAGSLDARWMAERLAGIRASEEAGRVADLAHHLRQHIKADDSRLALHPDQWAQNGYATFCNALAEEDRRLVRELKLALRSGVAVFEDCEGAAIEQGGEALIAALRDVPAVVAIAYARLATLKLP